MVELDDLCGSKVRGRDLGQAHHHNRPDAEVRDDEAVRWSASPSIADLGDPGRVEAGGADNGVDSELAPVGEVAHHHIRSGELDDDVGLSDHDRIGDRDHTADRFSGVMRIEPGDQLEVVLGGERVRLTRAEGANGVTAATIESAPGGQAVEIISITMLVYLTTSLTISLIMNRYNRMTALKGL